MRRTERLFALGEHLRSRRTGVTAEQLAQRFGVTVRTIYRDLDALREAALPLTAERGPGGGYALEKSYTLPPVNFTAREAALLVALGRFAIDMRLLPFAGTLESGLDKVRAALSTSAQRELLTRIAELSFHGVPALPSKREVRAALERAWFEQQPVRITYVDSGYIESQARHPHLVGRDGSSRDAHRGHRSREEQAAAISPRPHHPRGGARPERPRHRRGTPHNR